MHLSSEGVVMRRGSPNAEFWSCCEEPACCQLVTPGGGKWEERYCWEYAAEALQCTRLVHLCALGVVKADQSWYVMVTRPVLITAAIGGAWHQP